PRRPPPCRPAPPRARSGSPPTAAAVRRPARPVRKGPSAARPPSRSPPSPPGRGRGRGSGPPAPGTSPRTRSWRDARRAGSARRTRGPGRSAGRGRSWRWTRSWEELHRAAGEAGQDFLEALEGPQVAHAGGLLLDAEHAGSLGRRQLLEVPQGEDL